MVEIAAIQKLIEELGPTTDELAAVAQLNETTWGVAFDETTFVTLELDEPHHRIVLSLELGAPEESRRLEVYEALLGYNLLWRDTGGVKMAMGGDEGTVFQLYDLDASGATLEGLRDVLLNFVEKGRIWRAFVADTAEVSEAPVASGMRV